MSNSENYNARLEEIATEMTAAIELAVSIIDDTRLALVNPDFAQKKLYDALDRYNGLKRDFDNT